MTLDSLLALVQTGTTWNNMISQYFSLQTNQLDNKSMYVVQITLQSLIDKKVKKNMTFQPRHPA